MKFILFSDSEERRGKVLSIFTETGREIIALKDLDLLFDAVEKSNFPIVLIDVKFSKFPAYRISREIKEKYRERNIRTSLIVPSVKKGDIKKILELWLADDLIYYDELEEGIRRLLNQFPLIRRGNFKDKSFLKLLLEIKSRAISGTLTVNHGRDERAVYFEKGMPKYSMTSRKDEMIGGFLLRHKKLTQEQLEEFLKDAKDSGKRLGEFLVEKGIIEREGLRKILQEQMEKVFESIFAWDDADWTLSAENIAQLEDVLIERELNELIYNGVMRYAEVEKKVDLSLFPKLLVEPGEITSKYPLNQKEKELIEMFSGNENIESLPFKSECTLKEIERLCYLFSETGLLELLPSPREKVSKTVIGRIETREFKIEPFGREETRAVLPEPGVGEVVLPETVDNAGHPQVEKVPDKVEHVIPWVQKLVNLAGLKAWFRKRILQDSIITISLVLIISLSVGLLLKKRAEERLLNERIVHSTELIKSDSIPALKKATQILSDCMKKNQSPHLISLLAFADFRIFEITNDRRYLEEAKKVLKTNRVENDIKDELKPLVLLISMADGDMVGAGRVLNEIRSSLLPLALYSKAKYTIESTGDIERAREMLSSVSEQDMVAIKLELANALSLSGELDKMREILRTLEQDLPGHPDVIILKGDERYMNGDYDEAESLYRIALETRPGHLQTTIRLARTHLVMNQPDSVVRELEPVIQDTDIKTNCGKLARLYYARALQRLKNLESARELFLQLAKIYPQDDSIKQELESVERILKKKETQEKGRKETVREMLRTAKRFFNKGKYEEAIKVFERGLDKADDEFLYWYGLTLEKIGNSKAAFLQFKKAEGINPENALVHKELGKLYKELGNEEEAANQFKLYLKYFKK